MNSSIIFYNTTANNNVTQSQSEDQGILMVLNVNKSEANNSINSGTHAKKSLRELKYN